MPPLHQAIHSALTDCLKLHRNEKLLILADEHQDKLGIQFYEIGKGLCNHPSLCIIPTIPNNGYEPPTSIVSMLKHADAALLITRRSLSHTQARSKASQSGVRIASLPNISKECLSRTLTGNYRNLIAKSRKIADILTIGRTARLTTPAGTDLTFSLSRMQGYADTGMVHEPGQFSNLPAGEGCAAPVQGSMQGVLVIDGSFPEIGKIETPVRVFVKDGYAARIIGKKEADHIRQMLRPFGKLGRNIAEVGIGTNPHAKFTGCTLEDEKCLGTVHVAFGNNVSFGGKVSVKCHFDSILLKPTLLIDGQTILDNGTMCV